jgi:phosphoglucosamine mutase
VRVRSSKLLETDTVKAAIAGAEGQLKGVGRLVVRASGTEPVIRVMAEGEDRALVESVVSIVSEALGAAA